MAFWNNKKKGGGSEQQEEVRGAVPAEDKASAKAEAAAEKQRLKKIRAMKKKFDETVWPNAVSVMRQEIPAFTLSEPDPDIPGSEMARYVLLGFDTKIVDDFANKSDDDVGSIMTAIKSSMDCVIQDSLFDNELILIIPTARSLAALAEFEDTFDLKFYVSYVTEDHSISLETKTPDKDDDFIYITLPQIRDMLANNVFIKDQIRKLQAGAAADLNPNAGAATPGVPDGDEAISEDEYESEYGGDAEEEGPPDEEEEPPAEDDGPPDEAEDEVPSDEEESPDKAAETKAAAAEAVAKASGAGTKVSGQKDEVAAKAKPSPKAPGKGASSDRVRDRMNRIRTAAQQASDEARADPEIAKSSETVRPQGMQRFDDTALDQYIDRKYYSDDLGLEISSQPFDAMFVQGDTFEEFKEEPGDSWLGGYVNNVRRDANTRLRRLHEENLMLMRKQYLMIIAKLCEGIVKSVATDDPKSRFGFMYKAIHEDRETRLSQLPEQSDAYKRECEESYQSRLRAEMENAANTAKASFMNRYGRDHERELREIETDLKNNIESEYVAAMDGLNIERRKEAKRQFDIGVTEALRMCNDEYTKMLALEREEYGRLQAVITRYMNDNMASDEARIHVLSEEQRRTNEIDRVRGEYDSKLSLASADFEARLAAVKAEINQRDIEHDKEVARIEDRYEHAMQQLRSSHADAIKHKDAEIGVISEQLSKANAMNQELTGRFSRLEQDTESKYDKRIQMLQQERDAWNERADHLQKLHTYTDKIKITTVAVLMAATLAVGIIVGFWLMSLQNRHQAGAAMPSEDVTSIITPTGTSEPEIHYFIDGEEVDASEIEGTEIFIGTEGGGADENQ